MTDQQPLPLADDDAEAHAYYLSRPPRRSGESGDLDRDLYWRGLMVNLNKAARDRAS